MYTDNNILINILFETKVNCMSNIGKNHIEISCRCLVFVPQAVFISPKWFTFYLNEKLYWILCNMTHRLSKSLRKILVKYFLQTWTLYVIASPKVKYFLTVFLGPGTWIPGLVQHPYYFNGKQYLYLVGEKTMGFSRLISNKWHREVCKIYLCNLNV